MKSFKLNFAAFFVLLVFVFSGVVHAQQKQQKQSKEVREFIKRIDRMREDLADAKTDAAKDKIIRKARKNVLRMLDIEEIARLSLGKYFFKFSPDQKEDFFKYFEELMAHQVVMAHVPPDKISSKNADIEVIDEKKRRDKVFKKNAYVVRTRFPHKEVFYNIDFYLHKKKREFKLYDIHVDGASILLDYRKQFYSIIQKKGSDYLIDRIKDKVDTLNSNKTIL
ncbi:MAG: ABC transporter substrate-binding protein [Leptospirales bacterium]